MKKFKLGFTLAEVLITLTVIGVVAAITLPSLQANIEKQTLAAATSKAVTVVGNAVNQYMAEVNVDTVADFGDDFRISEFRNYFKIKDTGGHFANSYRTVRADNAVGTPAAGSVTSTAAHGSVQRAYQLNDGIAILLPEEVSGGVLTFMVDVNGQKGPNRAGRDLWQIDVSGSGIPDAPGVSEDDRRDRMSGPYSIMTTKRTSCTAANPSATNSYDCLAVLIRNGYRMDYY